MMTIRSFWHHYPARPPVFPVEIPEGQEQDRSQCCYSNGGGYSSLKEMQTELMRRNKWRKPELIPNGIRIDRPVEGYYQEITWEAP